MKKNIFLKLIILLIVILFTIPTYSNAAMTIDDIINGGDNFLNSRKYRWK